MGILTGDLDTKVYRIEALINNSFEKTLKDLIEFVLSDYDVKKYHIKIVLDQITLN